MFPPPRVTHFGVTLLLTATFKFYWQPRHKLRYPVRNLEAVPKVDPWLGVAKGLKLIQADVPCVNCQARETQLLDTGRSDTQRSCWPGL